MLNIREYFNLYLESHDFDAYMDEVNGLLDLYEAAMNENEDAATKIDKWAEKRGVDLSLVNEKFNETYVTLWLWDYFD